MAWIIAFLTIWSVAVVLIVRGVMLRVARRMCVNAPEITDDWRDR